MKKMFEETQINCNITKQKHIEWIDLLRCFAICCVVLVHVTESIYPIQAEFLSSLFFPTRVFVMSLMTIGRLGVPIFLFISGYLLLDREYDERGCIHFWKRNLLGLFITTEVWVVLYNLFLSVSGMEKFSAITLMRNLLFLESMQSRVSHVWYLFLIIGMYIFIPFLSTVLRRYELKILAIPFCIAFGYFFLVPMINLILGLSGRNLVSNQLSLEYSGGMCGVILVIGYCLKKDILKTIHTGWLFLLGGIAFVGTVIIQYTAYMNDLQYIFNNNCYNCVLLLITAVCIFVIVSRMKDIPLKWVCKSLAKCSFGIYLVHWMIRIILIKYLEIDSRPGKVAVVSLLTLIISWIIVELVSKIPKVNKLLFFIK